jgi:hypothetical protein
LGVEQIEFNLNSSKVHLMLHKPLFLIEKKRKTRERLTKSLRRCKLKTPQYITIKNDMFEKYKSVLIREIRGQAKSKIRHNPWPKFNETKKEICRNFAP